MNMKKRTVAALLNVEKKSLADRIKYRRWPRHTYVICRSRSIARRFLRDAEAEGFTFGDGIKPTEKETDDIFALNPDFTLSYTGWIGHLMVKNGDGGNVVRIDYGKYVSGAREYRV